MAKKLIGPLTQKLNEPRCAMSLQYEIIQTCTTGLSEHLPTIKLCVQKLREFIDHPDRNLKYLGLVALNNLIEIHPKAVAEHRDVVIQCLESDDDSIRRRALDLVEGMANKKNVHDIVERLCGYMAGSSNHEYRQTLVEKVINMCSKNTYALMSNFDWYISILVKLAHMDSLAQGDLLSQQMMDVLIRVKVARPNGIKNMVGLLRDTSLFYTQGALNAGGSCEVLYAAAWLVGEFADQVETPQLALEAMLHPRVSSLPAHVQAAYLQSVVKLFSHTAGARDSSEMGAYIKERISTFTQSSYLEVQERACFAHELLSLYSQLAATGSNIGRDLASLFAEPLNPVHPKVQKKIVAPAELKLDEWINEPDPDDDPEDFSGPVAFDMPSGKKFSWFESDEESENNNPNNSSTNNAESNKSYEAYAQRVANDPFYLSSGSAPGPRLSVDDPSGPPEPVDVTSEQLGLAEPAALYTFGTGKAPKARKRAPQQGQAIVIMTNEEMPEGINLDSDDEKKHGEGSDNDADPFGSISFDKPLTAQDENVFARPTHYTPQVAAAAKKGTTTTKKGAAKKGTAAAKKGVTTGTKKGATTTTKKGTATGTKKAAAPAPQAAVLIDFEDEPSQVAVPVKKAASKKGATVKKGGSTKKGAAKKETPQLKPLCQDESLSVLYEIKTSPNHPKHARINFAFKNLSNKQISRLSFNIRTNMQFQLDPQSVVTPEIVLDAGETANHSLILSVVNFFEPSQLPGILSFKAGDDGKSIQFKLNLPSSSFVIPTAMTEHDFIQLLQTMAAQLSTASGTMAGNPQDLVPRIAKQLHLEIINFSKNAYLYGKTMQGHHVAVCLRSGSPNTIEIKSTNSTLGSSLLAEICK